ncbi:RsmB/NOP family class I SAM-dependent RNA methyltransferase [uncultured Boseongicola sp.]|uniref:RsmB/NOP family class I SAM-dependent RNA methyltransferase n=1 Tax=uncultured Boseongicola sp. TaxID=1648499 RepID=UPI002601E47F|nr:RsmB/NOP family class I SAM-dependent RNA methyltransferase [uncultured Boseongicola sp.]
MTPAARVQAAIEILDGIQSGSPVEKALTGWARHSRFAGSKDRAAVRDHVFGVLRCKRSVSWLGGGETGRDLMLGALRDAEVDPLTLFNGVGYGPAPLSDVEQAQGAEACDAPDPVRLDVPDWLWSHLQRSLGTKTEDVLALLRHRAPVHLRANTLVTDRDALLSQLSEDGYDPKITDLTPTGVEIGGAPRGLTALSRFADGWFEMQDAASQAVVDRLATYLKDADVLDYCAGGGGKALAMAAYRPKHIVAYDTDAKRMSNLPERTDRARANIEVVNLVSGLFDLVLCDAPCSGSGAWRRQPAAKWDLTPEFLAMLQGLQVEILNTAKEFVRPGGYLAYVTCSLLDLENDISVDAFLAEHPGWRSVERLVLTPLDGGDGFYLNVLQPPAATFS